MNTCVSRPASVMISSASVRTETESASSDNYHIGLYGSRAFGPLSLRSGLNYTFSGIETVRDVTMLGQKLKADYDAGTLNLFGELGYRMAAGGSPSTEPKLPCPSTSG